MTAALLVDHAVRVVAWRRSAVLARAARVKIANLEIALETSRVIGVAVGIVMQLHKITKDEAFDLLRETSQHTNVRVRDLAADVIETGWLDPSLVRSLPRRATVGGRDGGVPAQVRPTASRPGGGPAIARLTSGAAASGGTAAPDPAPKDCTGPQVGDDEAGTR